MFSMRARSASGRVAQLAITRKLADSASARPIFILVLLTWNFRTDRQPPHAAALAVIVVDRRVLRAAVVPDGERPRLPAHAAGEFRPRLVRLQEFDQRPALRFAHVLEPDRVRPGKVKRFAPGLGMRTHHRML